MSKFTDGPWKIDGDYIIGLDDFDVCNISERRTTAPNGMTTQDEQDANARLIAAAPLMYEALERLVQGYRNLLEVDALPAGTQWEIATQELIEFGQAALDAAKVER